MEAVVENSLEATNWLVDKHFDKGWDKFQKHVNGKKVEESYKEYDRDDDRGSRDDSNESSSRNRTGDRSSAQERGGARYYPLTGPAPTGSPLGANTLAAAYPGSRRKQRNTLPSPERDIDHPAFRRDSIRSLQQESRLSDRILREYELETDDPKRNPESVLSSRDLRALKENPRTDSAMASGYNDGYSQAPYAGEGSRPRSQPPRSKYYDDDDSDYDERSGRRYDKGNGRGYDDDRDYDRVVEETERYRGPPVARPTEGTRRGDSYRTGYDGPYGAGAVTQYGRRSDGALDRQESYVTRRSKSRGRDDRDRSYSRSPSRSRSRSRSRGEGGGIRGQLENAFDTSGRGLGVGIAGAVIGGLAGREFGNKNRQRDVILGALVGGLGANAAENQYHRWKDGKEREVKRDEGRWEEKWDGRDSGRDSDIRRSRSNVR